MGKGSFWSPCFASHKVVHSAGNSLICRRLMTKFSLSLFLLFDYDYCFINLAMLPPLLFYTLWHWFSLVTAQIECLCETQRRVCVKETLRIIYKHLQNFKHPLNHFVLSSKILKWYKTVQKFYQRSKIFGPQKFFISEFSWKYCEILRKIQNFAKKRKQIFFLPRIKFFWLSEEIFTFCTIPLIHRPRNFAGA